MHFCLICLIINKENNKINEKKTETNEAFCHQTRAVCLLFTMKTVRTMTTEKRLEGKETRAEDASRKRRKRCS